MIKTSIRESKVNSISITISENCKKLSHLGGVPLLPKDFVWPVYIDDYSDESYPLSFVAQFDCTELSEYDKDDCLPDKGLLSFFYDVEGQPWGSEIDDKNLFKVYWFDDIDSLTETNIPDNLSDDYCIPHFDLVFEEQHSHMSWEDYEIAYGDLSDDDRKKYFNDYIELEGDEFQERNKLLGWADVIQNNMTVQCEELNTKVPNYNPAKTLDNWQLLLQLSSINCGDFELLFGDCGKLYFYIRKEDLKKRHFDDVWCILQC